MAVTRLKMNNRMSQVVVHGETIYLAGQVPSELNEDVKEQTRSVLGKIDALLVEAGSSKSKVLSAVVYLSDMANFGAMNEVWDAWVDRDNPPARATVGAPLARAEYLIEILVVAAR
jgi:enamine deaminase RidA (YjgF/YER057c/UK114 family)